MNMAILEVKDLKSGYKNIPTLHSISFKIESGECLAIVGSNGAGKTTLLKTISGLIQPFSGNITFEGISITNLEPHKIVGLGIVQVPEGRQLFSYLSVLENLHVGSFSSEASKNRQETLEQVWKLFPVLWERRAQLASSLSGGEQQMLATARALMARPKLLMMDEPSWGLAPMMVTRLFETCCEINKKGCTLLLVEQHVQKALSISNRGYVLERGNIVMEGEGNVLLKDQRLRESYLGM
jgi:branched-chain amino acid transport system ATP-binding protein